MTHRQPSSCLETSAFKAMVPAAKAQTVVKVPGRSTGITRRTTLDDLLVGGSIRVNLSERGWTIMRRYLLLLAVIVGALGSASAQSCPSGFSSSGSCGVSLPGAGGQPFAVVGTANGSTPSLSGSRVDLIPSGTTHAAMSLNYQKLVNVQGFTANFTFVPNGQNVAFVLQNSNNNGVYNGASFSSGAGCEAGFYQAFQPTPPNNIFALELDSWSYLGSVQSFSYSSAQIYQSGQSPCNPNDSGPGYYLTDKISTSPVPLNSPAGSQGTSTGDTYSATVTYNGSALTLNLYDVTAGGACPGAKCFTQTWNVDIPSWVGGNTAWVGFTAATGETSNYPLYIDSFDYSEGSTTTPADPPSSTTQTATPTFSPAAGTYSSAQSVTLSDATSDATIYYTTNGTTPTTSSTKYTGAIAVSSTETLQAIAVASGDTNSGVGSAAYTVGSTSSDPGSTGSTSAINYSSGFAGHPSQLYLGNSSVYSGSSIELTNTSGGLQDNAWYKTPVNVQAFTTTFTWNAICPAKPALCGDGMGFIILSNPNPSSEGFNYSGSSGSQFSWSRCSSSTDCASLKSVLVKFDLYNNSTSTGGANLTGFYSGGVEPQPPQAEYDMSSSGINMESGHLMKATLAYNGTVLTESVTDTVTGATYRNSYSANIPALVGGNTAFVGFGGSSGSATVTQNLQSWTYAVESPGN
jgi:Chitobiase/beta-hexosaminidase C-terminal domain/Legume lectin domain